MRHFKNSILSPRKVEHLTCKAIYVGYRDTQNMIISLHRTPETNMNSCPVE